MWGIPRDRVLVVVRDDPRVEVDRGVYLTSDRVAIKATMRVGFAFPHPAAIVKITTGPETGANLPSGGLRLGRGGSTTWRVGGGKGPTPGGHDVSLAYAGPGDTNRRSTPRTPGS